MEQTPEPPLTLSILGCGTMGVAILSGILSSLSTLHPGHGQSRAGSGTSTPNLLLPTRFPNTSDITPTRLPTKFTACVKRPESATRVRKALEGHSTAAIESVEIFTGRNADGVRGADVIILGCKPQMYAEVLGEEGVREALEGKLLVSILAGVTIAELRRATGSGVRVVRAMPNTSSKIRESMTVISAEDDIPSEEKALVSWIFSQIGRSLVLGEKHMDACTALCGSGPAFYALIVEAMADGGVMMGLPRAEAQMMAAQTMQGAGRMVLAGQHPAIIREQVSTPGGCTIGGLLILEDGKVRSTIARTIQEATNMAAGLGKK